MSSSEIQLVELDENKNPSIMHCPKCRTLARFPFCDGDLGWKYLCDSTQRVNRFIQAPRCRILELEQQIDAMLMSIESVRDFVRREAELPDDKEWLRANDLPKGRYLRIWANGMQNALNVARRAIGLPPVPDPTA